jgi:hypothetical protein
LARLGLALESGKESHSDLKKDWEYSWVNRAPKDVQSTSSSPEFVNISPPIAESFLQMGQFKDPELGIILDHPGPGSARGPHKRIRGSDRLEMLCYCSEEGGRSCKPRDVGLLGATGRNQLCPPGL